VDAGFPIDDLIPIPPGARGLQLTAVNDSMGRRPSVSKDMLVGVPVDAQFLY
jgi:hypothetical protein